MLQKLFVERTWILKVLFDRFKKLLHNTAEKCRVKRGEGVATRQRGAYWNIYDAATSRLHYVLVYTSSLVGIRPAAIELRQQLPYGGKVNTMSRRG